MMESEESEESESVGVWVRAEEKTKRRGEKKKSEKRGYL
jgi:hypothetical protein